VFYRNWLAPVTRLTRTELNTEPERPAVVGMPGYAAVMTVTQEQFGSLKEDIRALSSTVSKILHTVRDQNLRVTRMDERLTRVEGGLDLMDGRLTRVEGRLDKVDGRLDKIDDRFDKMDGRLDKIDDRFDKMDGRLDGLQSSVSEILTLVRKDSAGGQAAGSVDVGTAG
jgi:chromosome segregation ATPase